MKGKFWRKALAAALALLIVSGGTPIQPLSQVFEDIAITASAESTITPVTPQLDSDGFYSIGSAEELYGFAELVNSGNASANAKLTADIVVNENVLDANGEANTGDFVQWTPIGNDDQNTTYSGTFDGQGHTVSGLYVSGSGWYVGFVGQVSGTAVVKNLGIVDSYFSSSNNYLGSIVGGVAAKSPVTIANVYSTSTVKGDNWIGGLVGNGGRGSVSVVNSYFAGKTSANWTYGAHHDDLVSGSFNVSNSGTLNIVNTFVVGTSQYGTSVTAEQLSDGTVAAALHYYQDALADGSMFGINDGKTAFSGSLEGVSVTTADVTLHTFDGDATAYSSKYIVGNTTPLPVMVEREGYRFSGWYDNADFEGDAVTQISSSATGDKEYWAKFVRSHSVSFVLNEGSIFKGEIDHYIEGETTVLPTMVFKNGASFEGWYTMEDFTGSRYYSIPATANEDMTFYAKWGAEKTTFYLRQGGSPEPVNVLYEGENMVWLDKTTMDRYVIFDNSGNPWGSNSYINVSYTGGESTFGDDGSKLSVAQSGFYVFTLTDKGDGSWFVSVLRSMNNCTVSDIAAQTYTGSAIEPEIVVTDGETTLTLGTDYTVTYSDNTNAGTAKATITGKGKYFGTVEKTFNITRKITISDSIEHGTVEADRIGADEGDTVTLTVTPDEGYQIKSVKYNDTEIEPANGVYSFSMPDGDVTVNAEFENTRNIVNAANITLGGELGLNFYLTIPDDVVTAGAKVVMNGPEGEKEVALSSLSKDDKGRYKVTYKIKAVYMNENVSLNVTDSDGNTLDLFKASGSQVDNNTLVYSIYDYVQSAKADTALTEKEHNMVDTMYIYGAYSAKWFNGTALPDDVNELNDLNMSDYEQYKLQTDGSSDSITLTGLSLILDSNTALRLYFTSADDISGHSAKVDGVDLTIHPTETARKYYVEIDDISANNLISNYSIVFDGTYTATVSTMTYVYNSLKNGTTDDVMNVLKALCAYSDAVNKS